MFIVSVTASTEMTQCLQNLARKHVTVTVCITLMVMGVTGVEKLNLVILSVYMMRCSVTLPAQITV